MKAKAMDCHSNYTNLDYPIHVLKAWVGDMAKAFPVNHDHKDKRSVSDYTRTTDEMLRRIKAVQRAIKLLENYNDLNLEEELNVKLYEK